MISSSEPETDLMSDLVAGGVHVDSSEEAGAYLDWAAKIRGLPPSSVRAIALGTDLIFVRPEYADCPRIVGEEFLHLCQCRAGRISSDFRTTIQNEIDARVELVHNSNRWGISQNEVDELQNEIETLRRRLGSYEE